MSELPENLPSDIYTIAWTTLYNCFGKIGGEGTKLMDTVLQTVENEYRIEKATAEAEKFCPDGVAEPVVYPEHTWWREDNRKLVKPKPDNPHQLCCPRCYSILVEIKYPEISCLNCRYNESLIDFSISQLIHKALGSKEDKYREGLKQHGI